jgi:hypothetical protein
MMVEVTKYKGYSMSDDEDDDEIEKIVKEEVAEKVEAESSKLMAIFAQKIGALIERMEVQVEKGSLIQEKISAGMQQFLREIEKNGKVQEIHEREADERRKIDLNHHAAKMEALFATQNKAPKKQWLKIFSGILLCGLISGVIGAAIIYFGFETNAERQHQLVAGKVLKVSWSSLSKTDQDKIMAIALGAGEAGSSRSDERGHSAKK